MRLLICLVICASLAAQAVPIIANSELRLNEGVLDQWTVRTDWVKLGIDTDSLPPDVPTSISLAVAQVQSASGEILQRLPAPSAGQHWRFRGWIRSSVPGCAYLSVKRYAGKQELSRASSDLSTTAWSEVAVDIPGGEADRIEVLLRWKCNASFQNARVWFASPSLVAVE